VAGVNPAPFVDLINHQPKWLMINYIFYNYPQKVRGQAQIISVIFCPFSVKYDKIGKLWIRFLS